MNRSRTKLVCTIGPASIERVGELVAAGMDVARINFSHGTPDDYRNYVHAVRAAAHSARRSVAVMADLPGPKIRLGQLSDDAVDLVSGGEFTLRAEGGSDGDGLPGDASGASVSVGSLATQLEVGDRVLLADGAVELRVDSTDGSQVKTEVVHGGQIRTRSGVNIPSSRLAGDGLTDDDRAAVPRALELRVDLIAQSFIRNAEDVRALKQLLPSDGPRLVAKIETQAAVDAFDEIARVVDGIMVARGDLGVDIPFEDVPLVQKDLIRRAGDADRFTIVATQMLESMTGAARPTRAEASDVANAVLDGADAVMLSAETAIGRYPVESLQAMARICSAAEQARAEGEGGGLTRPTDPVTHATATILAATAATSWTDVGAIWCFTRTGHTAEKLSTSRPRVPIVAFTLSPIVARRLAVRRGVIPMVLPANAARGEPLIDRMASAWRAQRDHQEYESVILVTTSNQPAGINRLEVQRLTGRGGRPQQAVRPARAASGQSAPRPAVEPRQGPAPVAVQVPPAEATEEPEEVASVEGASQAAEEPQAAEELQAAEEPQAAEERLAADDEPEAAAEPEAADEPQPAEAEVADAQPATEQPAYESLPEELPSADVSQSAEEAPSAADQAHSDMESEATEETTPVEATTGAEGQR